MKKFRAILAGILASASVLSITACSKDEGTPTATTTGATTTTYAENSAVNEAVANMDITVLDNPDLEVTERIEWMAWWPIDETTPAAILFKDVYGIPTTGDNPDCDGMIFDYTNVAYGDRYTKLANLIAADDSPDLFPFEALDFPYGVIQGRYNPVSDIINVESPKWNSARDMMEQFRFGEDYYCVFYEISFNNIMYYKKSNIESIGAEDPRTLFEAGNWTWDTFLDISRKWQDSGENKWCLDGYNPENDIMISTGVPMVGNDGTQLVNNLYDPAVERAEALLTTLQQENLRYPRHELNGWSVNPKAWANNQVLFYADGGTWVYEDTLAIFEKGFGWEADEIQVVPFPRDPQADAHYVTAKQDALMWVKGSDNPDGVAAWIDCCVTASSDPAVREAAKAQQKENKGWSDYNLDAIYAWTTLDGTSPLTPIFDFKGGLGAVSDASATQNPVQCLTNMVYLTGDQTYAQLREENNPALQAAIDEINEFISNM